MSNARGFTLIELMIAVAVIGILAALAYPSYLEHVAKSRRAEAKGELYEMLQREERFYTENNRYTATLTELGYAGVYKTEHATHTITLGAGPTGDIATSVTLTATPIIADARCGVLTLTSTHVTSASGTSPSGCW